MFVRKKEFQRTVSKIYEHIGFHRRDLNNYKHENEQENLLPIFKKLNDLESRIKQLEERK